MSVTTTQVKLALSELKQAARKEPALAFVGCLSLMERLGPAGTEFDDVLANMLSWLPQVMKRAKPNAELLLEWQNRLYAAFTNNPERLAAVGLNWGKFCSTKPSASSWADRIRKDLTAGWIPTHLVRPYLASLLVAERYTEILSTLDELPHQRWEDRLLGVAGLAASGETEQALEYAKRFADLTDRTQLAACCEQLLIAAGRKEEAYTRYALVASEAPTYVAWFRAIRKKYPERPSTEILQALIAHTPGNDGKWFAAAKDAKLYTEAIALVQRSPADVRTLLRAARSYAESEPNFAMEAGLAALHWMLDAPHFEISNTEVWSAYNATRVASTAAGCRDEAYQRMREMFSTERARDRHVTRVLSRELGLS